MTQLPPFDALIAFEAAARLGGMTRAAHELGLTQSAISHRIRRLEQFMGTPLLLRQNGGIIPTPAGSALLDALKDILDSAADLRSRCLAVAAPNRLRVGVGSALVDRWLVRRLPDFSARHPETSIELVVVENEAPERTAGLDVRILWVGASDARASSTQRPLFREHVFPVCSPSILPRGSGPEWSWQAWFARLDLPGRSTEAMRFASIGPAISSAIEGAGAALARSMLVADALAERRLVRVLPPEMDQLSQKVHVVRWPGRLAGDGRVEAFASWLCAKASAADSSATISARSLRAPA